jgi:hypothetical protein
MKSVKKDTIVLNALIRKGLHDMVQLAWTKCRAARILYAMSLSCIDITEKILLKYLANWFSVKIFRDKTLYSYSKINF